MREKSFPFDWIAKTNLLANSNITNNITTIKRLVKCKNAKTTTAYFLSNYAKEEDDTKTVNCKKIWFPHEEGTKAEIFQKYERRFQRFYETITQTERPCIFFMVTRTFYISPKIMQEYIYTLLQYHHPDSKIYFFSGKHHKYLLQPEYQPYVVFQYVYYDTTKFYDYDYTDFRPNVKKYIENTLCVGNYIKNTVGINQDKPCPKNR
jgi:hypothetical protein